MRPILDISMKVVGAVYACLLLIGGIAAFRYSVSIDFYPSGIGVGDSLFFISTALMFIFTYSFFIFLTIPIPIFIVNTMRIAIKAINFAGNLFDFKLNQDIKKVPQFVPIIAVPFAISLLVLMHEKIYPLFYPVIYTIELEIPILFFLYFKKGNEAPLIESKLYYGNEKKYYLKIALIALSIVSPLILTGAMKPLVIITMEKTGIRIDNADLLIKSDAAPLFRKEDSKNKGNLMIRNASVLWTGVGKTSLIEQNNIRYVIPTSDFFIRNKE